MNFADSSVNSKAMFMTFCTDNCLAMHGATTGEVFKDISEITPFDMVENWLRNQQNAFTTVDVNPTLVIIIC